MLSKERAREWLLVKLEQKVYILQQKSEALMLAVRQGDLKASAEAHKEFDHWFRIVRNVQRLIDELEEE